MSGRNVFLSLLACVLAVAFLGTAPVPDAAWAAKKKPREGAGARSYVLEGKRRARGPRIHLPIGPSYTYYDYPYYYSRGHYPTHIGGYVYYPYNYYSRGYYARYGNGCSNWLQRCAGKSGDRRGSASSRRQKGACRCP